MQINYNKLFIVFTRFFWSHNALAIAKPNRAYDKQNSMRFLRQIFVLKCVNEFLNLLWRSNRCRNMQQRYAKTTLTNSQKMRARAFRCKWMCCVHITPIQMRLNAAIRNPNIKRWGWCALAIGIRSNKKKSKKKAKWKAIKCCARRGPATKEMNIWFGAWNGLVLAERSSAQHQVRSTVDRWAGGTQRRTHIARGGPHNFIGVDRVALRSCDCENCICG